MPISKITATSVADNTLTTDQFSANAVHGVRNLIINGAMTISQRNGTSSITPANYAYLTDRFQFRATQGSKFNAEQSTTAATGFKNSLKMTVASAYTVTSSDQFGVRQFIEGQNISHLEWGTANAKSVTLSFWVRSSVTGTHSGALGNSGDARAYPFSFTVSSADTLEYKTISISGDTSGTWLDTNGIGIKVNFNLGAGSNHLAAAGSWTTGEIVGATGSVSIVGTSSATFYITGVQLEVGQATPFEHRSFGDELLRCKRYYHKLANPMFRGIETGPLTAQRMAINFYPVMRASPTSTLNGTLSFYNGSAVGTVTASNLNQVWVTPASFDFDSNLAGITGSSAGNTCVAYTGTTNVIDCYAVMDAEL